jgi:hypothetical protein
MTVLATLIANAKTFSAAGPHVAQQRVAYNSLRDILASSGDFAYPANCVAVNEVQEIAIHEDGVDGGTFTLKFTLANGTTFTTAAIAFGANAATITTAINTAAGLASVPGWTNGDIVVTGGPLTTTPLVLTFSGASVAAQNMGLTVIDGTLLTDGGVPEDPGVVTVTTAGQATRTAWAALMVLGLVTSAPPVAGVDPVDPTVRTRPGGQPPHNLEPETVRLLVLEAAAQDNFNPAELLSDLGLS